ncbi:MAG: DUF3313 family protein [Pseudomonadales bacterium]
MKYIIALALSSLLSITGAQAQADENVSEAVAAAKADGELVKGKSSFKEIWVNPSVDFAKYNKIFLGESTFEFRDVGPAKKYRTSSYNHSSKNEYGILSEDQEKFKTVVGEAFVKELSKSKKYDVVTEAGPNTLLLEGSVLDIVSHVPPETVGRSDIYLSSVATVTLVIEILDSQTGQVIAYVEERRKIEPPGGGTIDRFSMPSNSVTVWSDVRRWASRSASRLRSAMEKAQKAK